MNDDRKTNAIEAAAKGIPCRRCGCLHHRTIETRQTTVGRIRRRRICRSCGYRFVTYERAP